MRRIAVVLLLVILTLSACATNTPVSTTASEPVAKTDFVPTDPNQVRLAAGKPQFIEFFAFW